jgi:hypothetical protein
VTLNGHGDSHGGCKRAARGLLSAPAAAADATVAARMMTLYQQQLLHTKHKISKLKIHPDTILALLRPHVKNDSQEPNFDSTELKYSVRQRNSNSVGF